jgi:hypothetical protein
MEKMATVGHNLVVLWNDSRDWSLHGGAVWIPAYIVALVIFGLAFYAWRAK